MFLISSEPLEIRALSAEIVGSSSGALVTFEGWVRDENEGQQVDSLEYQVYHALATSEGNKLITEALKKFDIHKISAVHREGHLAIGDIAVWVGVTAAHRGAAFDACCYIIDEIKHRLPIWKKEHYTEGDAQWVYCSDHDHSKLAQENINESEYYCRQLDLPDVGIEGQRKLKAAKVAVVGAGGLGCPALTYLATAGVGHIKIIDSDTVTISNLHRQSLFTSKDLNKNKAQAAKERLESLNPLIHVTAIAEMVEASNSCELIEGYDIVLDCTDNLRTKYILNDTCYLNNSTLVLAGIHQWQGILHTFLPRDYTGECDAGCYRCLSQEMPTDDCVGSCVDSGVIGVIPGLVGGMQALEALRLILSPSLPASATSSALIDLRDLSLMRIKRKRNPSCSLCGERPGITGIWPETYDIGASATETSADFEIDYQSFSQQRRDFEALDIRNASQRAVTSSVSEVFIREMRHIPQSAIQEFQALPADKKYLLVCQHGISSKHLAATLHAAGQTNFYSLVGGLTEVDMKSNK
jgi:sulfur-carrier protein adenylyltransferase/sulfurtransferase